MLDTTQDGMFTDAIMSPLHGKIGSTGRYNQIWSAVRKAKENSLDHKREEGIILESIRLYLLEADSALTPEEYTWLKDSLREFYKTMKAITTIPKKNWQ